MSKSFKGNTYGSFSCGGGAGDRDSSQCLSELEYLSKVANLLPVQRTLTILLTFLFIGLSTTAQNKKASLWYQRAQEAFKNGDAAAGWNALEKSMNKSDETYYLPFALAGDQKFAAGAHEEALGYYDEALSRQSLSTLYYKKSLVLKSLLRWDESIAAYEVFMRSARLSPRRLEEAETGLANLKYARQAYELFIAENFNWNVQPVPFNTDEMEYFPCLTGDGQTLIFTRRNPDGEGSDENLYASEFTGSWWSSRAAPLKGRLNSVGNEGAATISADGELMIFTACDRPGGKGSCDLYYSYYHPERGWDTPEPLPGEVNTGRWESQPSLAPDGKTLYFVRGAHNRDENIDIYMATLDEEGNWSDVKPLPSTINSSGQEIAPFIHFDGETLFFTSNRAPSIGDKDFFVARKLNDTTWSEPVNLGMPINGFANEFSLIIDPSGEHGYFASDRGADFTNGVDDYTKLDLYAFNLPESLRPQPTQYANLRVVDAQTRQPIGQAEVKVYAQGNGALVFEGYSRGYTGLCRPMLHLGADYGVTAYKEGYLPYSDGVVVREGGAVLELALVPITKGTSFVLNNILFDLDKSDLQSSSERELTVLLKLLQREDGRSARIVGHTDNQGSAAYNKALSLRRAETVVQWLVARGIDPKRLQAEGRGMEQPVASNDTEEGRAKNRRTEVILD